MKQIMKLYRDWKEFFDREDIAELNKRLKKFNIRLNRRLSDDGEMLIFKSLK